PRATLFPDTPRFRSADLLGGSPGGQGGGAVQQQQQAVQRNVAPEPAGNAAGGNSAAAAPGGGTKDRYRIEVKAWIPHSYVVDPEEPIRASDWLDTISRLAEGAINALPGGFLTPKLKYEYHSKYHGDGHSGYAGSYRAMTAVEFDWDGSAMSAVKLDGNHYGATTRYYDYRAWLDTVFGDVDI